MKKLIHRGFFLEVFRQLRTPGIIMACILMLFNVGPLFNNVTALIRASLPGVPDGGSLAVYMMLFIYIASLVLTFIAYNWMNRRSTSDFYHALPIKRTQIYWSTFLAIVLWIVIAITGYALVHALLYLITGMPFNYLRFLCVWINMVIGTVQVVGIVSLACALSGTRFVNLFSAAAILIMPRALLMLLALFIQLRAEYLPVTRVFFLFDPSYNIFATPYMVLFSGFVDLLGGNGISVNFCNGIAMLYSLVHAVLLAFLGQVAFVRRASESAGMPMKNRFLQAAIRTAFGLPLLLILVLAIYEGFVSFYLIVILVLFAFTFYCLYELISTKSAKRMLKAMPLFTICIGIAALYLFIPQLIGKAAGAVKIDENSIASFEIENYSDRTPYYDFTSRDDDYVVQRLRSTRIDDADAIRAVARAYRHTLNPDRNEDYAATYTVRIHRNGGTDLIRTLRFTAEDKELLKNAYQLKDSVRSYPKGIHYYAVDGLNQAEANEIGRMFREEFESLPEETRQLIMSKDQTRPSRNCHALDLRGVYGVNSYTGSFKITDLTPKTAQRVAELLAEKYDEHTLDHLHATMTWMETNSYPNVSNGLSVLSYSMPQNLYIGDSVCISFGTESYWKYDGKLLPKYTDEEIYEIMQILTHAELTNNAAEGVTIRIGNLIINSFDDYPAILSSLSYGGQGFTSVFNLKLSDEQYERILELYQKFEERESALIDEDKMGY